jgi:hypothetical protein
VAFTSVNEDLARARCAFVGGLKEESRMYKAVPVGGVADGLRIWKVSCEEMKEWRCLVYVLVDMRRSEQERLRMIVIQIASIAGLRLLNYLHLLYRVTSLSLEQIIESCLEIPVYKLALS